MRLLFVNNDGGGFADYVNVPEGMTVEQFFKDQMPGHKPEDYLIRVNRQPVPRTMSCRRTIASRSRRPKSRARNRKCGSTLPARASVCFGWTGALCSLKGHGMNEKELIHVAYLIQEALGALRKSRYLECVRQLSLFTGSLHEMARGSRNVALALSHDWWAAAEECCKGIARHLGQIPYGVAKLETLLKQRHKEVPTLRSILEELKAVQEEFEDVAFNPEEGALSAITDPITLEDTYLGPFRIALYVDRLQQMHQKIPYYVIAVEPHPAAKDEAITHPHVSNEMLCEGDGAGAIRAALEEGRLCDFFVLVRGILTTYNPDSPYLSLADWDGTACYDCGYLMDAESVYYCSHCDHAACDACARVCTDCGEVVCGACASRCAICDRSLCPGCANTKCSACESLCCESCITDGLCPDCQEERDNDEEQETPDDQGTTDEPKTADVGGRLAG